METMLPTQTRLAPANAAVHAVRAIGDRRLLRE
jgi:hypothetical protein